MLNKRSATVFQNMRDRWQISLLLLCAVTPLPLLLNGEKSNEGAQAKVAFVYLAIAASLAAFFCQVYYVGRVIESSLSNKNSLIRAPIWRVMLSHVLGVFVISLFAELSSLIPFFVEGLVKNGFGQSTTIATITKTVLSIPLFLFILELWFRYFRSCGRIVGSASLTRKTLWHHHHWLLLFCLLLLVPAAVLPDWGPGMAVATALSALSTFIVLETLGLELNEVVKK